MVFAADLKDDHRLQHPEDGEHYVPHQKRAADNDGARNERRDTDHIDGQPQQDDIHDRDKCPDPGIVNEPPVQKEFTNLEHGNWSSRTGRKCHPESIHPKPTLMQMATTTMITTLRSSLNRRPTPSHRHKAGT